jgi:hypothetical protein
MSGMSVRISVHAYERGRQRFKWENAFLEKIAQLAFDKGLDKSCDDPELKEFISRRKTRIAHSCIVKIFIGNAFVFSDRLLVTVFQLPKYLKQAYYKLTIPKPE